MIETSYTSEVVCPICGHIHTCSYEFGLDDYPSKIECMSCGEEFEAWHDVSVTYSSRVIGDTMIKHTDSCYGCYFQECNSDNCVIPAKSGYESEKFRNYDDNGYDAWYPCAYYIKWGPAIDVLAKYCEDRAMELLQCPFCDADAEMQHDKRMGYRVCCSNWKTCSGCIMVFEYNESDAIAAWNRRAGSEGIPEWLKYKIESMESKIASDKNPFIMAYCDALKWVLSLKRDQ
jgi:hypothetical protein